MVLIKYLGHSCFYIQEGETSVIIDPYIENPLSVKSGKVEEFKRLNPKYLLITHAHLDHLGQADWFINKGSFVIAIFELFNHLRNILPNVKGQGMNIGGNLNLGDINIKMVKASHSNSIIDEEGNPIYLGEAVGFIIELNNIKIYHMGDTGIMKDFELIGELYEPDIVLIPIGSLFTMGPKEAIRALKMLKPKIAIPMHYNTWPLIEQDPFKFKEKVEKEINTKVEILEVGEEKDFNF